MDREQVELDAPGLDRPGTLIRYGHYGRPMLVFPSEQGRAWDYENNGMVGAVADLVEAGRVKLYCVDSYDHVSWSDRSIPLEERARRHGLYESWILEQVVPAIGRDTPGASDIITTGCSLGAFHALNFALKRADLFPIAICQSGNYDAASWHPWGERGDATYFSNPADYLPNLDGDHLEWFARPGLCAAHGRPGRLGNPPDRFTALGARHRRRTGCQGHPVRAGPVGTRRRPRLAVTAQAVGPPPSSLLLGVPPCLTAPSI